jgi:putative ABC transport system permease protein
VQRTREIGIRKVLGASVPNIVELLSKDFLKLVMLALMLGAPIAWYLTRQWLQNFVYRVELHWSVFVLVGVLAVVLAFLTISVQSLKAALANPVHSLRTE